MPLSRIFTRHLLITNAVSYGTLLAVGELSEQTLAKSHLIKTSDQKYDYKPVARYFVIGTFFVAPAYFYWYRWLDKVFVGRERKTVVIKLMLDQMVLSPVTLAALFTSLAVLDGNKSVVEDLRAKLPKTYMASCIFWVPAQTINFAFLPSEYRVLTVGCFSFVWVSVVRLLKENVH